MRSAPFLLGLCLALGACGPSGASPPDEAEGGTAVVEARAKAPSGRRAVSREPVSARVDPEGTWSGARDALRRWTGGAPPERVDLETPAGTVAWTTRRPDAATRPASSLLRIRLDLQADTDGGRFVDVAVSGSPWVARHGCDASFSWRIPGWGEAARGRVAADADLFLVAVEGDPRRLRVELAVAGELRETVRWADVLPLLEAWTLVEPGALHLDGHPWGHKRARSFTDEAFAWFAAHQAPDGRWPAADFGHWCDGMPMREAARDGAGHPAYDVGATGLALCAFLGAGYTNRGRHPYAKRIARAFRWLKKMQGADGCFADPSGPWRAESHAIATLALVEIFGMTESPLWRKAAQRGLDFLPTAYAASAADDHVATFFTVAALASAGLVNDDARKREKAPPLVLPEAFAEEMRAYVTEPTDGLDPTLAAVSLFGRIVLCGESGKSFRLSGLAEAAGRELAVWEPDGRSVDMPYWLIGTLALYQVGGVPWKRWNGALKETVFDRQRRDGAACCYRGTWDPHGPGAERFGRVGATALGVLLQEVYYRYDKVMGTR